MRIVSLHPSATEILCEIGLADELVGISEDSDWPPEILDRPAVTRGAPPSADRTTGEIGARILRAVHGGADAQLIDDAALAALRPDVVVTQERCRTCRLVLRPVSSLLRADPGITVVTLEPTSIEGIFNAITTVGAMTETEDDAIDLVESLRARLGAVEQTVQRRRDGGHPARRVVALESLDPPVTAGHWVPEQIGRAGGWDLLGEPGQPSLATSWEAVRDVDPDMLLLMPADLRIAEATLAWERTPLPAFWGELKAVQTGRVFLLDGPAYFGRFGPRVIDGVEILAEIFDPDAFVDTSPPGSWTPLG